MYCFFIYFCGRKNQSNTNQKIKKMEKKDNELRNKFCGMDISDAKKELGYWWTLDEQNVNSSTGAGSYVFSRKGQGVIKFTTEHNIIVDVEDLRYCTIVNNFVDKK